jgi:hypothetical protein
VASAAAATKRKQSPTGTRSNRPASNPPRIYAGEQHRAPAWKATATRRRIRREPDPRMGTEARCFPPDLRRGRPDPAPRGRISDRTSSDERKIWPFCRYCTTLPTDYQEKVRQRERGGLPLLWHGEEEEVAEVACGMRSEQEAGGWRRRRGGGRGWLAGYNCCCRCGCAGSRSLLTPLSAVGLALLTRPRRTRRKRFQCVCFFHSRFLL